MKERAYKYRFYPTPEQAELLAQTFGCVRVVYNKVLGWRTDAFNQDKTKIGYSKASAYLTKLKKETDYAWLNDVSCVPLQQCLRHQQAAFKNFFDGRTKYPTFKKKRSKQSIELTKSAFKYRGGQLFIAKSKQPLNIKWSRQLPSDPTTVTISKDCAGRYFVSLLCRFEPVSLPVNNNKIGVDVGLADLFVTSNGDKSGNPKFTQRYADKLSKYQRRLAKKKKGSNNFKKAKLKVAKVHAKITDCRCDFTHKATTKLINENQVIVLETLVVKNMIRNKHLSKAIANANWGEFERQLEYKANWHGKTLVKIDRWYPSSKRCSGCGHIVDRMPLHVRAWNCPSCKTTNDRDINAAINIKAAGLAVLACGS